MVAAADGAPFDGGETVLGRMCACARPTFPAARLPPTPHALPRYETTNHLWVILEYCVGGDMLALLRAEGGKGLPEASGALLRCAGREG